jgi:hypothetical protein
MIDFNIDINPIIILIETILVLIYSFSINFLIKKIRKINLKKLLESSILNAFFKYILPLISLIYLMIFYSKLDKLLVFAITINIVVIFMNYLIGYINSRNESSIELAEFVRKKVGNIAENQKEFNASNLEQIKALNGMQESFTNSAEDKLDHIMLKMEKLKKRNKKLSKKDK